MNLRDEQSKNVGRTETMLKTIKSNLSKIDKCHILLDSERKAHRLISRLNHMGIDRLKTDLWFDKKDFFGKEVTVFMGLKVWQEKKQKKKL